MIDPKCKWNKNNTLTKIDVQAQVVAVTGLNSLRSVEDTLTFLYHDELQIISGLTSLESVGVLYFHT